MLFNTLTTDKLTPSSLQDRTVGPANNRLQQPTGV